MLDQPADVFVGRGDALAVLSACISDVQQGRPWVVLVQGPAGVGKSALVRRAVAELSGFTLLTAAADELAVDEPMWLLRQLTEASRANSPFAGGLELLGILADRQSPGPVAVVVEDLHWADDHSRQALLTALRRLEGDRVLAIVTTRPDSRPDDEGWARLGDDQVRCRRITLGALSAAEVGRLAEQLNVPLGPNAATRLQRHTAGLALHVRTLLRELTPDELNAFGALPAPRSLAQTTAARIAALPAPSVALVRALAVLGGPTRLLTLGRTAGIADPTAALEAALATEFVGWSPNHPGTEVRFAHPLYAAAVYDDIPPVQRRRLHLAAAALDSRSSLTHRIAAADQPDDALAAELDEAAAAATDSVSAAHYLVAAADLSETPAEATARLLAAGRYHLAAGDVHRLLALQGRLQACPSSADRDVLLGWIAWQQGDVERAERLLLVAVEEARSDRERAVALLRLGSTYTFQSRGREAIDAGRAVLALETIEPADEELAWRVISSGVNQSEGGVAGLTALADRYLGAGADPAGLDAEVQWAFAVFENCAGRPAAALVWFERLMPRARHGDLGGQLAHVHMMRAQCHYRVGAWDEALLHAHAGIDLATDDRQSWILGHVNAVAAWVHAGRGQWELAERRLEHAHAGAEAAPIAGAVILTRVADALLANAQGRPADVIELLSPLTTAGGIPTPAASNLAYWPILIHALVDAGRHDDARREATLLRSDADARQLDLRMQLSTVEARLLAAAGDPVGATTAFEAAIDATTEQSDFLDRIVLHHAFGRHLRAVGRRREALVQLAAARTLAVGAAAAPYVERLDVDLRRSDANTPPARSDPLGSLTSRERDVVTLIVRGATNREAAKELYVSVKAIEYHVGNVYAKLHINSRRELKALADGS